MIEAIKTSRFSAIHICLTSLRPFLARNYFSLCLYELWEPYVSFLEANQERNDRVTHYTHYGEQIQTIRTKSIPISSDKGFFVLESCFLVAYMILYRSEGGSVGRSVNAFVYIALIFQRFILGRALSLSFSLSLSLKDRPVRPIILVWHVL